MSRKRVMAGGRQFWLRSFHQTSGSTADSNVNTTASNSSTANTASNGDAAFNASTLNSHTSNTTTTTSSTSAVASNAVTAAHIASKRAEAKRELLISWEAFTEGRADQFAEEVCAMGEVIYGYGEWTRSIAQLGPVIPERQSAQELRREGGQTALIDAMMAFQEADEESYYEQVFDLGVELFGEGEWGIAVQRRMREVEG
ncbi:hypothetical protein PRZ48_008826 [Zasmidium cellare]|uniref:Uncharacterized protein n=1 Tax=Zasmidium cellare TaxID=395010 RepID=A0ABR0EGP4_ZASCE|nr:hypothetical protein PRZ48_008826 [Zasmidium cellare]